MADSYFDMPEAAALAGWSQTSAALARVAQVTVRGRRAEVVLDLEPTDREWVDCVRGEHGWREAVSGNGPTVEWDDPDADNWQW